ncbi:hypothetical protein ACFLTS_02000 [Chloroflexota bacterium]
MLIAMFRRSRISKRLKASLRLIARPVKEKVTEIKLRNMMTKIDLKKFNSLDKVIEFIESQQIVGYTYKYAKSQEEAVLYCSIYAVMTLSLFGKLSELPTSDKEDWADYIQSFQCEDGLFRDTSVANELAETEDWWGWRHLTCHAIIALTALNAEAKKHFQILEYLYYDGEVERLLESRDWKDKPHYVSNEILNYGTLLQYARDVHEKVSAGKALLEMYDWLDKHQDPQTGLWGPTPKDRLSLSIGVQTAYHIWLLYFYDQRPIQYIEQCIDSCLNIQNRLGGFGVSLRSNACEDIDCIDPLARLSLISDYRKSDIKNALKRAAKWVLTNMNADGGFVFSRGEPLTYGHKLMSSQSDESAMFPSWFRTLSLAYLSKAINNHNLTNIDWHFVDCPGYQFWRPQA